MKIALVDNGICETKNLKNKILKRVDFNSNVDTINILRITEHGTRCAEIINRIYSQSQFIDLKIIGADGSAHINKLLEALEWCEKESVKLIHLSLGTISYFDIDKVMKAVKKLIQKEIIIVAAYHNKNLITYPAAFKHVFGVRQDRENVLKDGEYMFQKLDHYNQENCIVAHCKREDNINLANSYAAPIITGHIAKFLDKNLKATFVDVLNYLDENAKKNTVYFDRIKKLVDMDTPINTPVIFFENFNYAEKKRILDLFRQDGYYPLMLIEGDAVFLDTIPMQYYRTEEDNIRKILYTVDMTYNPDIILIDYVNKNDKKVYDLHVISLSNGYEIESSNWISKAMTIRDAYDVVCSFLRRKYMKNKKDNEKIWLRIWSIIREYKKYFLIVFICLVGISFMTFLQPLIISQITDDGLVKKKNISNTILFSIILLCVSVTNQGMNLLMRKMFVNIHNGLYFSLYKKVYFKIERLKLSYFQKKVMLKY